MQKFKKSDIGKTFKQASGFLVTLISSYKENGERIFVAKTNRPNCTYWLYWNTGNSYCNNKNGIESSNYYIRKFEGEIIVEVA